MWAKRPSQQLNYMLFNQFWDKQINEAKVAESCKLHCLSYSDRNVSVTQFKRTALVSK